MIDMDNRAHKRHKTSSHCSFECAMDKNAKIKDISIDGICLETSKKIDTRNFYNMKLVTKKKEEISLKGEVVWSSLIKSLKDKGNIYPIYNIGLKFIEHNDDKNKFLKKLIERLDHQRFQIVEESIKFELNIANLYELFSSLFPEDSDFWNKLVEEENNHASIIRTARDVLLTCGEFPPEVLSPSLKYLIEENNKISSLKKEYQEKPPLRKSAFEVALSLERSAGEIHFNEAMVKYSPNEYIKTFQELNKDDKDHYKRILNYMKSNRL